MSPSPDKTELKILRATYGPEEGRKLLDGRVVRGDAAETHSPFTRNVTPFLRALVELQQHHDNNGEKDLDKRASSTVALMDGKSMNVIFGDPCPGTTKRLHVTYAFLHHRHGRKLEEETMLMQEEDGEYEDEDGVEGVCRSSFAEHERVVLRKRGNFIDGGGTSPTSASAACAKAKAKAKAESCLSSDLLGQSADFGHNADAAAAAAVSAGQNSRWYAHGPHTTGSSVTSSPPILCSSSPFSSPAEDDEEDNHDDDQSDAKKSPLPPPPPPLHPKTNCTTSNTNDNPPTPMDHDHKPSCITTTTTTTTTTSPLTLHPHLIDLLIPLILPYLTIRQRVLCQSISHAFHSTIAHWGIAHYIDVNDDSFKTYKRACVTGSIISKSFASLQGLYLQRCTELQLEDFHNAIPQLQCLRQLDVSYCRQMTDETLVLLAQHLGEKLRVLYMKGLRQTSDVGFCAICDKCENLQVLEMSQLPVTDRAGVCIGNLKKLEALYMRDNYQLSNVTVESVVRGCRKLGQWTLWGCTRLGGGVGGGGGQQQLVQEEGVLSFQSLEHLVLLNLWGCHGLKDEVARSLGGLYQLKMVIVSECHQLTDQFVLDLVQAAPQIQHLHLRYVRRITDASLHAMATHMPTLYSLDVSFCTGLTATAIGHFLLMRKASLGELRLYGCRQLDEGGLWEVVGGIGGTGGRDGGLALPSGSVLSCTHSQLSLLDVRGCGGLELPRRGGFAVPAVAVAAGNAEASLTERAVRRLTTVLEFAQPVSGVFVRPARWNPELFKALVT